MKIIRAETINAENLLSSNLSDTTTEWDSTIEYAVGDVRQVSTTDNGASEASNKVYTALRGSAGTASGATTNATGYAIGTQSVQLASAGTGTIVFGDTITFAGDTTLYTVTDGETDVSTGGTISFEPALAKPIDPSATAITVEDNLNRDPVTETEWWEENEGNNVWRMFNAVVQQQSEVSSGNIVVKLQIDEIINGIALLNIVAESVTIKVTDTASSNVVYNETVTTSIDGGVSDWYEWFFNPIDTKRDLIFTDIPPYQNAIIDITITDSVAAKCGACVLGQYADIGFSQFGAEYGIADYSQKKVDSTGNIEIEVGEFARTAELDVVLPAGGFGRMQRLFTDLLNIPVVWIISEVVDGSSIFGFYKEFNLVLEGYNYEICTLEIEGLA